jgi:hypothetical protein
MPVNRMNCPEARTSTNFAAEIGAALPPLARQRATDWVRAQALIDVADQPD